MFRFIVILLLFIGVALGENRAIIIFDASGSMWGQIDGKPKIAIAKDALKSVVKGWSEKSELGLMAYGHRRKGDCNDIEILIPVSKVDKNKIINAVMNISPKGKTPISRSLKKAANELKFSEDKATVILISDGKETCDPNPCKVAKELKSEGIDFIAHVIGFNVDKTTDKELECIAKATGGEYFSAKNAAQLNKAVKEVAKKTQKPTPPPKPKLKYNLEVSLSEKKGGKWVNGYCEAYNEDKSKYWDLHPNRNHAAKKKLPVGKYTLMCRYNSYEKKDIPFEIKANELTKLPIIMGETGNLEVSLSEKKGGKWVNGYCEAYNQDKSKYWDLHPRKKKAAKKKLPIGKYTLMCRYNEYKKEKIPFEIESKKTTKVHLAMGETGVISVTASEKANGKWVRAYCEVYNEDKSNYWSLYPSKKKAATKKLPIGKYTIMCRYNDLEKVVPFEIQPAKTTKVHIPFVSFLITTKCKGKINYEIYAPNGQLVFDKSEAACNKPLKVTLNPGTYTLNIIYNGTTKEQKFTIGGKENRLIIDLTNSTPSKEELIKADSIEAKNTKKEIPNSSKNEAQELQEKLKKAKELIKNLSQATNTKDNNNKEFEKMSQELKMFTK